MVHLESTKNGYNYAILRDPRTGKYFLQDYFKCFRKRIRKNITVKFLDPIWIDDKQIVSLVKLGQNCAAILAYSFPTTKIFIYFPIHLRNNCNYNHFSHSKHTAYLPCSLKS